MTMDVTIPKIQSKYITAFKNESSYDAAYPTFEEVNWSAIKPAVGPEELPDEYRLSRRLSHMYANGTPPDYKFSSVDEYVPYDAQTEEEKTYADAHQIAHHNTEGCPANQMTPDDIRKAFFLEIVWGYSGWEWHDYERVIGIDPDTEEPITETLKGGNLYKLKEITTVPHIIDGHRLYHINDFLNSQDKVTTVEDFDTSNLIAVNRAFKRLDLKHNLNTITPLLLKVYQFPNVEEANDVFFNNKISVIDNYDIEFPLLKNVDGFYQRGEFIDGTTFKLNSLESFTDGFFWTNFSQTDFNLGDILVGDSLKKVSNLSGLLHWAMFYNGREDNNYNKPVNTFTIDLSGSSLPASTEFNLSSLAYESGTNYSYPNSTGYGGLTDRYFIFNLTLKGLTDLNSAFRKIMSYTWQKNRYYNITIKGVYYQRDIQKTGPTNIEVNFNNTESLIRNLDYAFAENIFIEQPPITHWINNYTTENYIYQGCQLNDGIVYDFSPNLILNPSEGQFNDCYIDPTKTVRFDNVDALQKVRFQNINFGTETVNNVTTNIGIPFPYNSDFYNSRYQYNEDSTIKHRYINFSGSMFTSLKSNQTIYVTGKSAATMFDGCKNIDFTGSNIVIDMSPTYEEGQQWNDTQWTMFRNCSSMVRTPKLINPYIVARTNNGDVISNMFLNCTSLEYVDAEDFHCIRNLSGMQPINFSNCPNLVYLNMGNVCRGLNLRGCYNLDIDTLNTTLLRQNKIDDSRNAGDFTIQKVIWDRLPTTTQNHITSIGGNINIVEV